MNPIQNWYYNPTGGPNGDGGWEKQQGINGAASVALAAPVNLGTTTPFENDSPSTTVTDITGISARAVTISLANNDIDGTATTPATKFAYVAFNQPNGQTGVDTVATRYPVPIGESRTFYFDVGSECTKISYDIDAAPGTGAAVKVFGSYTQ